MRRAILNVVLNPMAKFAGQCAVAKRRLRLQRAPMLSESTQADVNPTRLCVPSQNGLFAE
jgi:hypothetical protein